MITYTVAPHQTPEIVDGIADLRGTRCLCFGAAVPFLGFAFWLPVAAAGAPNRNPGSDGLIMLLIAMAVALAAGLAVNLIRRGLHPGAWFQVSASGIGYGDGPGPARATDVGNARMIAWEHVVRNPERAYDIGTSSMRYRALNPRMTFWYRMPEGSLVERSLPLQLREDVLRCLRFRNAHAVRVAMLQHLARREGLRFHPDVFVEAGIDPETWQAMKTPRRILWLAAAATLACLLGFAALVSQSVSPGFLALGAVALLVLAFGITSKGWQAAYPRLSEIITFRPGS